MTWPRRRPPPRHCYIPHQTRERTQAALSALWARDVTSARGLLAAIPPAAAAVHLLPVAETLWVLAAELAGKAPPPPGPFFSPVCAGGFCFRRVSCYVPGCQHYCHARIGRSDDTVVLAPSG